MESRQQSDLSPRSSSASAADIPRPTIERRITLTLDYSVAPLDALLATKCDFIYYWMKSHCPAWKRTGIVEVEVCLIDMGLDYDKDEANAAITELDLVKAPDNLASWTLSKEQPKLQREIWSMDPGTVWYDEDGNPCFADLNGNPDRRTVGLGGVRIRWRRRYRVLALSKSK